MSGLRFVGYTSGLLILGLSALMLAPALVDALSGYQDWRAFIAAAIVTALVGGALTLACHQDQASAPSLRESFLIVVVSWVMLPFFGALPFIFGGGAMSFLNALFESVSGMTTTGATIQVGI